MKIFIHFLLISSLSIIIAEGIAYPTKSHIESLIKQDASARIGLPYRIKLLEEGEICSNRSVLVRRGKYENDADVAIKIFNVQSKYEREMQAYLRLNATAIGFDFMTHRIPRVYYYGTIFDHYSAIVMTLLDNNLENIFEHQGHHFSDTTILLIFKKVAEVLKYFQMKGVAHNHIQLSNVFILRGKLFIADFDHADCDVVNDLISDYESLITMTWRMVNNPYCRRISIDHKLPTCFENPTVRKAFWDIQNVKIARTQNSAIVQYGTIIKIADEALTTIQSASRPEPLDLLTGLNPLSGEYSEL